MSIELPTILDIYTSSGLKMLSHTKTLHDLQVTRRPQVITLQIAPTNKCNLNCDYCSVGNRNKHLELSLTEILNTIRYIKQECPDSFRAVELTGGGEPLLHPKIEHLIAATAQQGLSIGLITNGLLLPKISKEILKFLSWIRISINNNIELISDTVFPYLADLQKPTNKSIVTVGISVVWPSEGAHRKMDLIKLKNIADAWNLSYVRIVPNCLVDVETTNKELVLFTEQIGLPLMHQPKPPKRPPSCYFGYLKPYLDADGYLYPCNALSLAPSSGRDFHKEMAMGNINNPTNLLACYTVDLLQKPARKDACEHCRFYDNNILLDAIMKEWDCSEHI